MISVAKSVGLRVVGPALVFLVFGCVARAQNAPAPIGTWNTVNNINTLVVEQNGTCGFLVQGKAKFSGKCTWQASAKGGILTLTYAMPLQPGHIRWSVIYTNQTNITVDGEAFHKTAN